MKDFYEYGARNGLCIWASYGRVHKIRFVSNEKNEKGENKVEVLERGTANKQDFLYALKIFMEAQAEYRTADFMELYIGLTDDPEAKELADEIYHNRIDNDRYPVDAMKTLVNESKSDTTPKKNAGVNATFGEDAWNYIRIENGIVTVIAEGSNYAGRHVSRKDADFCNALYYNLEYLADKKPNDFIKFYHTVEGSDDVAFEIAKKVRKNKIAKINSIFNI